MCASFLRVSDTADGSRPRAFREGLTTLSAGWYSEPGEGPRLRRSITLMMMDLLTLSRKTGIWPERDVIKYIRSAIALDGLIKRFAPAFDVGLHLERICENQIKWSLRRSLISQTTLVDWGIENGELARSGVLRATSLFESIRTGHFAVRVEGRNGNGRQRAERKLVQLGAVFLVIAICASLPGRNAHFGMNEFTAETAIAGASVLAILGNLHRLI